MVGTPVAAKDASRARALSISESSPPMPRIVSSAGAKPRDEPSAAVSSPVASTSVTRRPSAAACRAAFSSKCASRALTSASADSSAARCSPHAASASLERLARRIVLERADPLLQGDHRGAGTDGTI